MEGDCTAATCPVSDGYLAYQPSLPGSAFMLAAFAVLVPIQALTGWRYKTPLFALAMICGLLLEVMSYAGTLLLRTDQARRGYFFLSIFGTVAGPTFISASVYTLLPALLVVSGQEAGLLNQPIDPSVVFLAIGFFTLAFQAVGCAFAVASGNSPEINAGLKLLLVGLALQGASLVLFLLLYWASMFARRKASRYRPYNRHRPAAQLSARFKLMVACIQISVVLILIRTAIALAQYSSGLSNLLAQSQVVVFAADGGAVLLACILLTVSPPGGAIRSATAEQYTAKNKRPHRPARNGEDLPLRLHDGGSYQASMRTQEIIAKHKQYAALDHASPESAYSPPPRVSPYEPTAPPYGTGSAGAGGRADSKAAAPETVVVAPYDSVGPYTSYRQHPMVTQPARPLRSGSMSSSFTQSTLPGAANVPGRVVPAVRREMVHPDSLW